MLVFALHADIVYCTYCKASDHKWALGSLVTVILLHLYILQQSHLFICQKIILNDIFVAAQKRKETDTPLPLLTGNNNVALEELLQQSQLRSSCN